MYTVERAWAVWIVRILHPDGGCRLVSGNLPKLLFRVCAFVRSSSAWKRSVTKFGRRYLPVIGHLPLNSSGEQYLTAKELHTFIP